MTKLSFCVPSAPRGKGSPRHTKRGFTYTDAKTKEYLNLVKMYAEEAMRKARLEPTEYPCSVYFRAYFPIPESYSKKAKRDAENGIKLYTKKPDTDNISKCKDALTGIVFVDDKQVWREVVIKEYSHTPRLEIRIQIHTPDNTLDGPPVQEQGSSGNTVAEC